MGPVGILLGLAILAVLALAIIEEALPSWRVPRWLWRLFHGRHPKPHGSWKPGQPWPPEG